MKKSLNLKYNSHLKNNYHSKLNFGKHVCAGILLGIMSAVVVIVIAVAGSVLLYRDANNEARENVAEKVQRNTKPKEPVYNQTALSQKSNHATAKQLVKHYGNVDHRYVKKMTYDPRKDVAKVTLNKPSVQAVKYASDNKKAKGKKLNQSVKTGVKIDNQLSNQAVEIANHAHDGYFTFQFANADGYQAPNTKSGNLKE